MHEHNRNVRNRKRARSEITEFRIGNFYLRVTEDGSVLKLGPGDAKYVFLKKYPRVKDAVAAVRRVWPEAQEVNP